MNLQETLSKLCCCIVNNESLSQALWFCCLKYLGGHYRSVNIDAAGQGLLGMRGFRIKTPGAMLPSQTGSTSFEKSWLVVEEIRRETVALTVTCPLESF